MMMISTISKWELTEAVGVHVHPEEGNGGDPADEESEQHAQGHCLVLVLCLVHARGQHEPAHVHEWRRELVEQLQTRNVRRPRGHYYVTRT